MDGRNQRGGSEGEKRGGFSMTVAIVLALCLLTVMFYQGRNSHHAESGDLSGAGRSPATAIEVGGTAAETYRAGAENHTTRGAVVEKCASCGPGVFLGSAETVAILTESLQTGKPYYLNGEPTPAYKANGGAKVIVNPTREQMLVDLRYYAQEIEWGTFKNGEFFDMRWSGNPYGTYISGGYANRVNGGRKWLSVGPFECQPDAAIPGIETKSHADLLSLTFPVREDEFSFAMNENMTVMYVKYKDWLVRAYDYENDTVQIVTRGGAERTFSGVIPGSAHFYKGWNGSIIFAYQVTEGDEAHYKLFRATQGGITALYESDTVIGMMYDKIGAYVLFEDGRQPPEIYLAVRVKDGIEIRSLGGIVIGTVSEAEYSKDNAGFGFFTHWWFGAIHPRHAQAIGVPGYAGWKETHDPDGWTAA